MAFDINLLAVIARGITFPILFLMAALFRKRYKESLNQYFNGYFLFFIAMSLIQLVTFFLDVISYIGIWENVAAFSDARFDDYIDDYANTLLYIDNFVRPSYLLIFIALFIAIASQVQPLEVFSQNEKRILSRLNFLCIPLIALIYVPFIRYTYYSVIALSIGVLAIAFGLLYNVFMNLRLAIKSVGELRKRFLIVLIGFVLFMVGIVGSARTGMFKAINPAISMDHEVIIGSVIIIFAAFLYYISFRKSDISG